MKKIILLFATAIVLSYTITAQNLIVRGSDIVLGTNDGRPQGTKRANRALVHTNNDKLEINYNGDFEGGTKITGNIGVGIDPRTNHDLTIREVNPRIALVDTQGDTGAIEYASWANQIRFQGWANSGANWTRNIMVLNTDNGNVGIGTEDPDNRLSVDGHIWAKEIKVMLTDGADWVFEEDYNLKPLEEVEAFIKSNKHLPEIPSADDFRENDMKVSEMTNKLLQKIEELTLYTIEQEKKIKTQNEELKKLKALEDRLKKLEELIENK